MTEAQLTEKLFCLAILQEGTETTQKILSTYLKYREDSSQIVEQLEPTKPCVIEDDPKDMF